MECHKVSSQGIQIIFVPIAVMAWFPFVSEFQARLLFNHAFSRGLHVSQILAGGKKHNCFLLCGCARYNEFLAPHILGWWLCERQVKSGGLNGRPEKLHDISLLNIYFFFSPFSFVSRIIFIHFSGLLLYVGYF